MVTMILFGHLKDGQLSFENLKEARKELGRLSDGRVRITVHPARETVSERLRGYYWALNRLIVQFLKDNGHFRANAKDIHKRNQRLYMSVYDMDLRTGTVYKQKLSHMNLTNSELLEVCKNMQIEWAERGLYLPDPREGMERQINAETISDTSSPGPEAENDPAGQVGRTTNS